MFHDFLTTHAEAIYSTSAGIFLGIVSSYLFYQKAKRDGERSFRLYKQYADKAQTTLDQIDIAVKAGNTHSTDLSQKAQHSFKTIAQIEKLLGSVVDIRADPDPIATLDEFALINSNRSVEEAEEFYSLRYPYIRDPLSKKQMKGMMEEKKGLFRDAIQSYESVCAGYDGENKRLVFNAYAGVVHILMYEFNDYKKAAETIAKVYELGDSWPMMEKHFHCLYNLQLFDQARIVLAKLKDKAPHSVEYFRSAAIMCMHDKAYQEGLQHIDQAIQLDLTNTQLLCDKTHLLTCMDKPEEAIAVGLQVLKLEPDNLYMLGTLADIYLRQYNFLQAERLAHKALTLDPGHPTALKVYFYVLFHNGKLSKVIELCSFYRLLDNIALHHETICVVGVAHYNLGSYDEAIDIWNQLLTFFPRHIPAMEGLCQAYIARGEDGDLFLAEQCAGHFAENDPNNHILQAILGKLSVANLSFDEAIEYFKRGQSLGMDPTQAQNAMSWAKHLEMIFRRDGEQAFRSHFRQQNRPVSVTFASMQTIDRWK